MVNDNNDISTADAVELRVLRQAWYNAVYASLAKLDKRVDDVSEQVLNIKDELKDEITLCRHKLESDFDSLEKSEVTLTTSLNNISNRLNLLENSSIKNELKEAIKEIEKDLDCAKDMVGKRRENCVIEFTIIKERLATLETKIWMFASVVGIAASMTTTVILFLIKEYVLKG